MTNFSGLRVVSLSLLVAAVTALAGCGEGEVKKEDVEKLAQQQLTTKVGKPSPAITCPGGLKAKVGTTMVCSMPIDGKTYDVNIKVTSVENSTANFDIEVADKPRP